MTTRAGWKSCLTQLAVSLTLSAAAAGAFAQQTIKIGEINSYKAQPGFLGPYKNGWSLALEQINAAVAQMDRTTQQNAAMVEQAAASAALLLGQARQLTEAVSRFEMGSVPGEVIPGSTVPHRLPVGAAT